MKILSSNFEQQLMDNITNILVEKFDPIVKQKEKRFIQQKDLMEELNVGHLFIRKMEKHGLKRIQLDKGDRIIFYCRLQVEELLESLMK